MPNDNFKECLEKIMPLLRKHYGERLANYEAAQDILTLIREIIQDAYTDTEAKP